MSESITPLKEGDLSDELWREYQAPGGEVYRIDNPVKLITRIGGSTHRVLDSRGIVHCVPFPGKNEDHVLRWKPKDPTKPVAF